MDKAIARQQEDANAAARRIHLNTKLGAPPGSGKGGKLNPAIDEDPLLNAADGSGGASGPRDLAEKAKALSEKARTRRADNSRQNQARESRYSRSGLWA